MQLNTNIIEKYNTLYKEVAKYYNLDKKIRVGWSKLYFISASAFGYRFAADSVDIISIHIEKNFPHLVPFYQFFNRYRLYSDGSMITLFNDINKSIKEIRKEKSKKLEKLIS